MTREEIFNIWAPEDSIWAAWVKPSLFMALWPSQERSVRALWESVESHSAWVPGPETHTAVIVDVPGAASVLTGLALAHKGYRPVPLFNCCGGINELVQTSDMRSHLERGADDLKDMPIARDAPPAFLLDSERLSSRRIPVPGDFDNRWVVFPQDFPSSTFLQAQGIRRVLLMQLQGGQPREDLAHVLMRWQETGMPVVQPVQSGERKELEVLKVQRPSQFKSLWYRALTIAGLRRNSAGGFGSFIPVPSQGSGGYHGGFG